MLPPDSLRRRADPFLREVDTILRRVHKTAPLGNKRDPLDELMFIQMTVRTRNGFSSNLYKRVKAEVHGDWGCLVEMPLGRLRRLLRPAGMANVKAVRLRGVVRGIQREFGKVTLRPLGALSDEQAERFLRSLPGVGPKVARCVLLYSLDRRVFPVDTHCRRIMRRLGFLPDDIDDKKSHDYLQALVPPSIRLALHVNFVHHGIKFCRARNPFCETCPLNRLCPTGRVRVRQSGEKRSVMDRWHGTTPTAVLSP